MAQIVPFVWLLVGSVLTGVVLRVAIPPFAWMALTFLLHASRSMPASRAVPCLWLGLWAAVWVANRAIIPVTGPAYTFIAAAIAATLTLPFALDRVAASSLVFPLAFAAVDLLRARFMPGATWGSLAYTQYGFLPLMQVAAFAGIWSITFLVAWTASTIEIAWSRAFAWSAIRTPVLACTAVLGVVTVGGALRLALAPTNRPALRVATLNRPVDLFIPGEMTRIAEGRVSLAERPSIDAKLARLHDSFLEGSRQQARAGARLIVWPEQNLLVFSADEPGFLLRARKLAAAESVYLAMGMGTVHLGDKLPFENKLVLIDPSGNIILSYRKTHPVEGWEAGIMKRGDGRLPVVATLDGRFAAAICYDADFPDFIRRAGQGSADLLILPANDWPQIKNLHLQMAAFRAIENGVPLIRATASGISGAFDAHGRLLATADYFAPGDRTLTVQLPLGSVPTLYARTGDLFGWLCLAALLASLAIPLIGRATSSAASSVSAPAVHTPRH